MSNIHKTFRHNELTIKRIIARYRPVQEDIDDLAQDVFVKSYAAEREKHILNPKAFIFKTAKHIAISEAKRKRHATTDYIEDFGGTDVYRDEDQLTAEHRLDSRQKFQALLDAIATLSPECRHALILKKIEGLKFKEIAAKLGVSVSTVEKRVASALILCNAHLRKCGYDVSEFGALPEHVKSERRAMSK